jgi:hypothetical protein
MVPFPMYATKTRRVRSVVQERRRFAALASALGDMPLGGVVDCGAVAQQYDFVKSLVIDAFIARLVAHNGVQRDAGCEVYTVPG